MHESLLSPYQHSSIIFLACYCYCSKAVAKFQRRPYQWYKQSGYSAHKRTGRTNTTRSLLRNKSTKKSSNVWIIFQPAVPWNLWTCAGGPNCLLHFRSLKTSILEEWKQGQMSGYEMPHSRHGSSCFPWISQSCIQEISQSCILKTSPSIKIKHLKSGAQTTITKL